MINEVFKRLRKPITESVTGVKLYRIKKANKKPTFIEYVLENNRVENKD